MTDGEPPDIGWVRTLALVGQLGLIVVAPTVAGVMAGAWLHRRFGGSGLFFFVPLVFGLGVGLFGAYRLLAREIDWNR